MSPPRTTPHTQSAAIEQSVTRIDLATGAARFFAAPWALTANARVMSTVMSQMGALTTGSGWKIRVPSQVSGVSHLPSKISPFTFAGERQPYQNVGDDPHAQSLMQPRFVPDERDVEADDEELTR